MTQITLLDGGMGQELLSRSAREVTPMWSADVMLHEPELVRDLHLDFISAGAEVITLNTYTATISRLTREGHIDKLQQLHSAAIKAAQEARALSKQSNVKIAASLPPLVASYRPESSLSFSESLREYQHLVALQASACDIIVCETMSSITEASAACAAAKESGKAVWVALTVLDSQVNVSSLNEPPKLRSEELLTDALQALAEFAPDAVLLNCSKPEAIEAAWPDMQASGFNIGAYANGFTSVETLYPGDTVEHLSSRKDLTPERYAQHALKLIDKGASIIGGCCEIGPQHIKQCHELIKRRHDH